MSDHSDILVQFCELTGTNTSTVRGRFAIPSFCTLFRNSVSDILNQAREYLEANQWDLSYAVPAFFADAEESPKPEASDVSTSQAPAEPEYTGPRTLDGRPAPQAAASSASSSKPPQKKKGLATLSSLGGGPSHDHDEDDDDDDDDDESERKGPRDLFAGGEKSGLAVQDPARHGSSSDPKRVIKDILAKAKAYVPASPNI